MEVVETWTGALAGILRQAYHYSQEGFAARLGVSTRTIAKWEDCPGMQQKPEQQ